MANRKRARLLATLHKAVKLTSADAAAAATPIVRQAYALFQSNPDRFFALLAREEEHERIERRRRAKEKEARASGKDKPLDAGSEGCIDLIGQWFAKRRSQEGIPAAS